jgi:hypothetical protein
MTEGPALSFTTLRLVAGDGGAPGSSWSQCLVCEGVSRAVAFPVGGEHLLHRALFRSSFAQRKVADTGLLPLLDDFDPFFARCILRPPHAQLTETLGADA